MPRLSNIAARALQRQIQEGRFARGAMLPGQRQLALDMGISRAALREAVSTLEALGLLRTQPGKGVYVTTGRARAADVPRGPTPSDAASVFTFRAVVEPGAAALAACVATEPDLQRLEAIQRQMEVALERGDLLAASEADLDFHLAMAEISGNTMVSEVIRSLEAPIAYSLRLPFADPDGAWVPAREHRGVLDAVSTHDSARAHTRMRHHIASAAERAGLTFTLPRLAGDPDFAALTSGVTP